MDPSGVAAAERNDPRTGLVLFGVIDLVVAIVYLIRALAIAFVSIAGANPRPEWVLPGELPVFSLRALLPSVFFMALGIGSILGRRWARSLSLVFSSLWLLFGGVTALCLLLVLPTIVAAAGTKPPLLVDGGIAVFGFLLPGAYVLFYRSPRVKAQCERLDPEERWTDRCPGVVLAVVIVLVVGASLSIGVAFSASREMLFFGRVLGGSVRLALAAASALQLLVAWELARGRRWAWFASVAVIALRGAGAILTARGITVDRLEKVASSLERLSPRDRATLGALRSLNAGAALTAWVAAIAVLALAIALRAGTGFRASRDTAPPA